MGSCQQAEATSRYVVVGTHDTISFTHHLGTHSLPINGTANLVPVRAADADAKKWN